MTQELAEEYRKLHRLLVLFYRRFPHFTTSRLIRFGAAIAIILTACRAPAPKPTVEVSPTVTPTALAFVIATPTHKSSPLPITPPDGKLLYVSGQVGNSRDLPGEPGWDRLG